ncbi:MAG: tetratricopeptide repeat protein [Alphaproteobacteria bacterium]|nr:tetratricopeptide repeat protein [Alphaproteobacteria bacterium]MCB9791856.1 tetratricopeptide repeat protein [Alphaproteobacteria bacterium]
MYNLLITLGVGAAAFGLGALFGRWTYGVAPALLIMPVVYFVLARRTGAQLEAIMKRAMVELQARRIDEGTAILRSALPLGRWQFLVTQQINAQLGALEYMQQNYEVARPLLEKAWSRNWQAAAQLAVLDARDGDYEGAVARLDKAQLLARKEPLYWAVSAWVLVEGKRADEALQWLGKGLEIIEENQPLTELRKAIANDKLKRFKWGRVFGQGWYQFFPDQVPGAANMKEQAARMGYQRGGRTYPAPRGFRR